MKRRRKCRKMEMEQGKEQEDKKNFVVKRAMVIIFITLKLNP
jgi:hypothetical protein